MFHTFFNFPRRTAPILISVCLYYALNRFKGGTYNNHYCTSQEMVVFEFPNELHLILSSIH